MVIDTRVSKVKKHPDFSKAGMVLVHNGVVRETSRDGKSVSGLEITINLQTFEELLDKYKSKPGIIDIQVEFAEEKNSYGWEMM